MTASVVAGQQYSRPGHSDAYVMAERDREGVFRGGCLNNHQSSRVNVKLKYLFQLQGLQDIALQSKGSLISRKTSYLGGELKESLGKVLPPRPSNPDPA